MDPYFKMRLDRVNTQVSLLELARDRYHMRCKDARDGAQVSCCFHSKAGRADARASAHIYTSSNRFWCFVCSKSLTVAHFVAKREDISLARAISLLEMWYKLAPLEGEQDLLMRVPELKLDRSTLSPRDLLRIIFRLMRDLVPYLTLSQYNRAFTAWWTLVAQKSPPREQCNLLLTRLLDFRDEKDLREDTS